MVRSGARARQLFLRTCTVDLHSGRVSGDRQGRLTDRERSLLAFLADRPLEVISRADLARLAFGYAPTAQTRAADKAMYSLRRKVERAPDAPEHLLTCFGAGYQFVPLEHLQPATEHEPPPGPPLVGRAEDLDRVLALLREGGIVALHGPVGVGKSALAREACRAWREDGLPALWCDAACEAGLPAVVGTALGLAGPPREVAASAVAARLTDRDGLLVVLDDADAVSADFDPLLRWRDAAPGVRWLVTARGAPAVPGVRDHAVAPLSVDDAAELFAARAAEHGQVVSADQVRDLVERLDRLPLALELAAARTGTFGLELLTDPRSGPLDLVEGRPVATASRHASLRAALAGPWVALSERERRVLMAMATHAGPLGPDRIGAMVGAPGGHAILGVLDRLVAGSWIHREPADGDEPVRFGMLRTVRAFAAERHGFLASRCP